MPAVNSLLTFTLPLLVFISVVVGVIAIMSPRRVSIRARLESYTAGPEFADLTEELSRPFFDRLILPGLQRLFGLIHHVAPESIVRDTTRRIQEAGVPLGMTAGTFLLAKAVLLLALPAAYGIVIWRQENLTVLQLGVLLGLSYAGFRLPDWYLELKRDERRAAIMRALPDALDLIVICVEAGLGLDAALSRVADRVTGPLSEELRYALAEMSMGMRRRDALRAMADRTGVQDLSSFVAVVVQADQTGVSIGEMLRVQADVVRVRRKQRAQEEGRKAPLKMLIPIIFFVLPATFGIILGPAILNLADNFSVFLGR